MIMVPPSIWGNRIANIKTDWGEVGTAFNESNLSKYIENTISILQLQTHCSGNLICVKLKIINLKKKATYITKH